MKDKQRLLKTAKTIKDYKRLSNLIKILSKTIKECQRLLKTIKDFQRLSNIFKDYQIISKTFEDIAK